MTQDPHLEADIAWLPLDLAPRDGTMLWLLMDYSDREEWSPLVDAELSWTIGFNNFDNTEEDRWQSVGWSWTQDFLLETSRRPVAWKPVGFDLDAKIDDVQGSAGERDAVIVWLESQRSISADAVRYVVHNARIDRLIARAGSGRGEALPADVERLVIAARVVAFDEDRGKDAMQELDTASEAFASRVRWAGDPEQVEAPASPVGAPDSGLIARKDVIDLLTRLANEHADLALEGEPDNARNRESAEAAFTRVKYAVAFMPEALASPAVEGWARPLEPTPEMIDAGAQRLASFGDDSVWPDNWSALELASMRNLAERVIRSAMCEAPAHVPDGWVLLPREPTEEMLRAARGTADEHPVIKYLTSEERSGWGIMPLAYYRAMLSAAPPVTIRDERS